jgi:transposase InsO family protein
MSDKPPLQSIGRGERDRRPQGGRRFFISTPTASRRWTYSCPDNLVPTALRIADTASHSRQILWLGVTAHPTAEWISHQLTEAYGWKVAPRHIIRDRDAVYGDVFFRRLRAMSIRDRPTAPRSPWQNGYCERAIGSIRRECLDHVVVFGERHLRHLLRSYASCYNAARTHLSVNKDAPLPRTVQAVGRIMPTPFLGGLHHLYVRV